MEAKPANLLKFVQRDTQFVIPIYQRTYSWTEKQCQQLWDDIERAAQDDNVPTHFLGSIVYIHEGVMQNSSVPQLVVIDGQQRLTTLSLLLVALREYLQAGHAGTDVTPRKINNYYLVNSEEEGDLRRKLVLTQNDRDTLIRLVDDKSLPKHPSGRILENYRFFEQQIAASSLSPDELWSGISKLIVVDIALERGKDNPQLIFESLNSTGLDLSETDKIRNFVLMDLPPAEQQQLYEEYWYPMEQGFDQTRPQQFDNFVRNYLTLKTAHLPNIKDIYPEFKQFAASRRATGAAVADILEDLHKYSVYYVRMARLEEEDKQLKAAFSDLNEFEMYVAYPFLLEVYDDYQHSVISRDDFVKLVRLVESYGFRRSTCGLGTNALNLVFANLSREIDKTNYLDSLGRAFLRKAGRARFPGDMEFQEQFARRDLYNTPRVKFVLRRLENFERKEPVNVNEYSIEHIMPQNKKLLPAWQEELGPDWQVVQQTYLHTIGNLTLTAYNSPMSDRSFADKRDMTGGFKDSPIRLNRFPAAQEHWNAAAILERAHLLADKAAQIWPSPNVSEELLAKAERRGKPSNLGLTTVEEVIEHSPAAWSDLFMALRTRILELDSTIVEWPHWLPDIWPYNHTSYGLNSIFADVVIQNSRVRICLNIKKDQLDDPQGRAKDVSGKGYWGGGDVLVSLTRADQLDYVMYLVEQAYEMQSEDRSADAKGQSGDYYVAFGEGTHRSWADAVRYGFVAAGHGRRYSKPLQQLIPGSRVFVFVPQRGYVGVGIVTQTAVRVTDFKVKHDGETIPLVDAPLRQPRISEDADDPDMAEYVVGIEWLETVPLEQAIWEKGLFANQNIVCRMRDQDTVTVLTDRFNLVTPAPVDGTD